MKQFIFIALLLSIVGIASGFKSEPVKGKLYSGLTGQEVADKYGKVFYDHLIKKAFVPKVSKNGLTIERMNRLAIELVADCCPGTSDCAPSSPACGCSSVDQEWIPDGMCCRCYWSSPDNKCYTYLTSSC